MKKATITNELKNILFIFAAAVFSFSSLHIFVIPSNFSPSGIDGISTMLYELTNLNTGWFKLMFNVPLLVLAWFILKERHVIYVIIFNILDSSGLILLEKINFYTFMPPNLSNTEEVGYRLISAIFSGVASGACTGLMLKIGSSAGGVDTIASILNRKKPNLHTERIISIFCYITIACSYFVYRDLTSVLLSVIQIFVFEWTAAALLKKERYAVEIKIITKEPNIIRNEILHKFNHSATVLKATGMFSKEDYFMVVTVLDEKNLPGFMSIMKQYPETFVYFTDGVKVQGEFHFGNSDSKRINAF